MRIKHSSKGKFYLIQCLQGSRGIRCWGHPDGHDVWVVPCRTRCLGRPFRKGREIRIPADPAELLPLPAESGRCGLSLIGDPEPEMRLAGVICSNCGEDDVNWLSVEDSSETAH